jgi:C_GCAxxG_C_C family probable redox protein
MQKQKIQKEISNMTELTEEKVLKGFAEGLDCSQQVLGSVADNLHISTEDAYKMSSAFGAGMGHAETCGCVVGALIALGLAYGHSKPNDFEIKKILMAKKQEFEKQFIAAHKSCLCKEILGNDLTTKEGMENIQKQKLLETVCPKLVVSASQIVKKLINERD